MDNGVTLFKFVWLFRTRFFNFVIQFEKPSRAGRFNRISKQRDLISERLSASEISLCRQWSFCPATENAAWKSAASLTTFQGTSETNGEKRKNSSTRRFSNLLSSGLTADDLLTEENGTGIEIRVISSSSGEGISEE